MLKKKPVYVMTLILGIILICASFLFRGSELKTISGVLIGVGSGLLGISIANLYINHFEKKNPEVMKQNKIEFKDERNTIIRNKAKAVAGDITQWFIMGVAYITIIINAPLWVTFATVCVFLLYNILGVYFMNKYQKEM